MTGRERHFKHYIDIEKEGWPTDPRAIPLLEGLDDEAFSGLIKGVRLFRLKRGDFAFQTGDAADQFYIVVEGRMKIYENTPEGREQILYIYHPGDFVGGLNVLKDHRYLYMGQVLEDALIATMNKEVFERYVLNNPLILRRILEKSYDRIRWAEDLISRLSSSNAEMKVAALLLRLAADFGRPDREGTRIELSMTREEMGSYAGVTRETVTRKLQEFKELGYLSFRGKKTLIVKDEGALRRYVFDINVP